MCGLIKPLERESMHGYNKSGDFARSRSGVRGAESQAQFCQGKPMKRASRIKENT